MAKSPQKNACAETDPVKDEIELRPDGWERFEQAIDAAARTKRVRIIRPKSAARAGVLKNGAILAGEPGRDSR